MRWVLNLVGLLVATWAVCLVALGVESFKGGAWLVGVFTIAYAMVALWIGLAALRD